MVFETSSIVLALLLGFVPALFWLWFWLQEERTEPEPRTAIALTFFTGMCVVLMVIPMEKAAESMGITGAALIAVWAFIEEIGKFVGAYIAVLKTKLISKPIDPLLYMITAALGFAALENTMFLMNPLSGNTLSETIITSNFRFLGATLLHVLCSAAIGVVLALSYCECGERKWINTGLGLILAGTLHALFNFFILGSVGLGILKVFGCVWLGIICILLAFEYIKKRPHTCPVSLTN
ncbi:MAG: PrsW family glutamic-type intramembrane protease [Minisyncoccia bacterium]